MTTQAQRRDRIENLVVGDFLSQTLDLTRDGMPKDGARWGQARRIVRIAYRGVSVKGHAYVGGDLDFGPTSTISFSMDETDGMYRIIKAD